VARKRLPYELWFATHLGVYGGILLVALHQLKNGGDFSRHFWFTAWWYMGYIGVFGLLGWYRFLRPVVQAWRHQFHVAKVVTEAHSTYSIHIAGRHLPGFRFQPGQYATWWMLAPGKWWQGHPFSFSSAPGADTLRLTIKASGNFTHTIGKLRPGTRIIIDGPRGSFTASRAVHAEHVLLVAGGIGITPYIAMIKQLLQSGKPVTLLYAARARQDVAFGRELAALQRKGLQLHLFLSKENQRLDATALQPFVQPGLVAYICGPDAMSASVHKQLRRLGVPDRAIITERFSF